jgi:hypothetical protein
MQAHHSITPSTHQMRGGAANAPFARHCAFCALLTDLYKNPICLKTNGLGDLGHNLGKVEVASPSLVSPLQVFFKSTGQRATLYDSNSLVKRALRTPLVS